MSPERIDEHHWKLEKYEYIDQGCFEKEISPITIRGPQVIRVEKVTNSNNGEEFLIVHSKGVCYVKGGNFEKLVQFDKFSQQVESLFRPKIP